MTDVGFGASNKILRVTLNLDTRKSLTIQSNIPLCVPYGVLGDTFVPSQVSPLDVSHDESHLYAVRGTVDLAHVVLVIGYYHLTCKQSAFSVLVYTQ